MPGRRWIDATSGQPAFAFLVWDPSRVCEWPVAKSTEHRLVVAHRRYQDRRPWHVQPELADHVDARNVRQVENHNDHVGQELGDKPAMEGLQIMSKTRIMGDSRMVQLQWVLHSTQALEKGRATT